MIGSAYMSNVGPRARETRCDRAPWPSSPRKAAGRIERVAVIATVCPVCAGADTIELLHLSSIPTNNVILCDDPSAALDWPVGSLRLTLCRNCGFMFNADFEPRLVEYSGRIEETQAFSPHFVRYAESLAGEWIDRYGIRGQTVLELGCGKAEFLSLMCEIGDNKGIGYDPAVHLERVDEEGASRLTLAAELFGEEHMGLDADVLVCRHTLEHIPEVHEFLSMLHRWAAQRSTPPIVLFEVPDVERILDEVAFWDVYYEHCSYFTADKLRFAFERAGFDVLDIRRVYDGQYLALEARPHVGGVASPLPRSRDVGADVVRSARSVDGYRSITAACRANLDRFVHDGKTVFSGVVARRLSPSDNAQRRPSGQVHGRRQSQQAGQVPRRHGARRGRARAARRSTVPTVDRDEPGVHAGDSAGR